MYIQEQQSTTTTNNKPTTTTTNNLKGNFDFLTQICTITTWSGISTVVKPIFPFWFLLLLVLRLELGSSCFDFFKSCIQFWFWDRGRIQDLLLYIKVCGGDLWRSKFGINLLHPSVQTVLWCLHFVDFSSNWWKLGMNFR